MASSHSNDIIDRVLALIDETNFHVCGGNWAHLNELLDYPEKTFGTLAHWVAVVASEWLSLPVPSDNYEDLQEHIDEFARGALGMSQERWDALQHLPCGRVKDELAASRDNNIDGGVEQLVGSLGS